MVRRHGDEEIHGTSLEESERAEFWIEKLQRVLDEVRCPPEQRVSCAVSLLQSGAYDWWKLVLRHPRLQDPITTKNNQIIDQITDLKNWSVITDQITTI